MKLTNEQNLPAPLVRAVTNDGYSKGKSDYSITGLLAPPRINVLKKKHDQEIVEDVSERLWMLMGTIGHAILQKGAEGEIVERRFFAKIGGVTISGQTDYGEKSGELFDFKFCSVWVAKDGAKPEWVQQLNCYRWLAHQNGIDLKELTIVAIYRDWSKNEAKRNRDYPQQQCQTFKLPVWSLAVSCFLRSSISLASGLPFS
jgi:hypothetical protein